MDLAQAFRGVIREEVFEQALLLVLCAFAILHRQDESDGFVTSQDIGFGNGQRSIVNAQAADIALERLPIAGIVDSERTGGRSLGPA